MAKYQLREFGCYDTERGWNIPNDPRNRHWLEYQEWLLEPGNVPDPIPAPRVLTAEEQLEEDLRQSDREWTRATEWFFQYLIQSGIIPLAEIPQDIKDLYQQRKTLRGQ